MMWMILCVDGDEAFHIIPINDLIEHEHNDGCVCGPVTTWRPDGWKMITHDSLDGREHYEPDWEDHGI